mgnify:CR=1 FL=1
MASPKVYVLADLHFGHKGVVRFRPQFRTVEEHDNYIMKKILQTCGKKSTLWLLGDCFFTKDSLKYLETLREAIGTIHLVLGNHSIKSDTEVLTATGWVQGRDLTSDMILLCPDESGVIQEATPLSISQSTAPHMYQVEGAFINEIVTPQHAMIIDNKRVEVHTLPEIVPAKCFSYCASKKGSVSTPYTDDMLRLLIWVITDGCMVQGESKNKKRIQWKLSKPRKLEALQNLLTRMGVPFTYKECKMSGINKLQPYYIRVYGDWARLIFNKLHSVKRFPDEMVGISSDQTKVLYDTLGITDGCVRHDTLDITTVVREDVDILQRIFVTNNYPCSFSLSPNSRGFRNAKVQYKMKVKRRGTFQSSRPVKITPTLGGAEITSISTITGRMFTRRDGCVTVTGNCSESGAGQANIKRMVNEKLVDKIHGLVNYKGCWMTHAPIHDSELRGKYCVYGHTHSVVVDDPRYFGVSCEQVNYTPIEFNKIKEILNGRNET